MEKIEKFRLGKIVTEVGLKGEVKVYPYTDYKERFSEIKEIFVENEIYEIEKVRYMGNMAIVKFVNIADRNAAETLKDKYLFINREDARTLPEDTHYIADLIGLEVEDESGTVIGKIKDVIQNTGQDLYEVERTEVEDAKKKTFLIPAVAAYVVSINVENKRIYVKSTDELMEL